MFFEQLAIGAFGRGKFSADDRRHDLAQRRGVIFRLGISFDALDAELRKVFAQARQRTLVQEAGEIVGGVGQQFAASDADE